MNWILNRINMIYPSFDIKIMLILFKIQFILSPYCIATQRHSVFLIRLLFARSYMQTWP